MGVSVSIAAVPESDEDNVAVDTPDQKKETHRPALAEDCRRPHRETPEKLKMTTTTRGAVPTVPPKIIECTFGVDFLANVVEKEQDVSDRFLETTCY